MPVQWLISLFAIFALIKAWSAYRSGTIDRRKLLYWSMFWVAVMVVIWTPQTASVLAAYLGVGRGVDLVLYCSVVLLFYLLFQASRKIDRLERSLTKLVRTIALEEDDRS